MPKKRDTAFTLAELLIALAILGVIATFAIPKVLQAQQSKQMSSMAKESMAAVSEAYSVNKAKNDWRYAGGDDFLLTNLNYVKNTSSTIDHYPLGGTIGCSDPDDRCMVLHNGGVLYYNQVHHFCNHASGRTAISFYFDPDGKGDGVNKSLRFLLYSDGRVTLIENAATHGMALTNNGTCDNTVNAFANSTPSWFRWD